MSAQKASRGICQRSYAVEEIKEIYFQGIQIDNKQVRPKEIKIETEQRFYNMKKVEQTISKITLSKCYIPKS